MSLISEEAIDAAEERLRSAMLHSDTVALDALLSDSLLFTSHQGAVSNKADDIAFHANRVVAFRTIEFRDRKTVIHPGFAVTSTLVHLEGTAQGTVDIKADLRYTRIWARSDAGALHVVAGHASESTAP